MKGLKKDVVGHSTRAPHLGLILKGWVERMFLISQPPDLNSGTHQHEKTDPQSMVFPVLSIIWLSFSTSSISKILMKTQNIS